MLTLLSESEVGPAFRELKGRNKKLAVAFWGKGAIESLGLDMNGATGAQIICNLETGATNPSVVRELMEAGASVKSHSRLHAKVYLADSIVILGSSNASGNGLVVEDNESSGWVEANVMTDDSSLVRKLNEWFDKLWVCRNSRKVDEKMLVAAQIRWAKRREMAPIKRPGKGLLDTCRANKELFDNVYLAIYNTGLNDAQTAALGEVQKGVREISGLEPHDFGLVWGYGQGWEFPDGAWIIDIDAIPPGNPRIWGVSRVYTPSLSVRIRGEGDLTLTRREPAIKVDGIDRWLRMSQADKDLLINRVQRLVKKFDFGKIPLVEALDFLDLDK